MDESICLNSLEMIMPDSLVEAEALVVGGGQFHSVTESKLFISPEVGVITPPLTGKDNGAKVLPITPFVNFSPSVRFKKRSFDILFSLSVMTLGAPVFLVIMLITKFSSPGPVFYKQERLGKNRRKFLIYKFRSMHHDTEGATPRLSRDNDPRITKWGRMMRKTRLDELPQFWNVIKGDMSVVGPRPEREFFAKQIIEKRPEYKIIQRMKPGLTSLGQVNYGYAENVSQMCDRLEHDLHYVTNLSLAGDMKVIAKTIGVMLNGRGK